MKLSEVDKTILIDFGYAEKDFAQIEEALKKCRTKYKLGITPISRETAIELLGKRQFLSGISRSAFHYTASRITSDGKVIFFDSGNLFR